MYIQWIFMNNYTLANCTKNFMTFCAKFLLTRQIVCAILEPQMENKRTAEKAERKTENDYCWNERVSFGRAERREKENAYGQRQSLFLHIHDL